MQHRFFYKLCSDNEWTEVNLEDFWFWRDFAETNRLDAKFAVTNISVAEWATITQ